MVRADEITAFRSLIRWREHGPKTGHCFMMAPTFETPDSWPIIGALEIDKTLGEYADFC